ncbi:MAG: hypothetical protein RI922_199, partial [Bacteroidota bacterium]
MKNYIFILLSLVFSSSCGLIDKSPNEGDQFVNPKNETMAESIHQFKVQDIEGNTFDFSALKGKKIMVVNTASKCGLTPQYEQLEEVYSTYKDSNFVI